MVMSENLDPIAAVAIGPIQVLSTTVRVHQLTIERPAVAAYLQTIAAEKREIAFVHALEVGVTELLARRERAKK
jgi:hypothetical protein